MIVINPGIIYHNKLPNTYNPAAIKRAYFCFISKKKPSYLPV